MIVDSPTVAVSGGSERTRASRPLDCAVRRHRGRAMVIDHLVAASLVLNRAPFCSLVSACSRTVCFPSAKRSRTLMRGTFGANSITSAEIACGCPEDVGRSIGNFSTLRRRSPRPWPWPHDIICHSQTLAPQEPLPQPGQPRLTSVTRSGTETFACLGTRSTLGHVAHCGPRSRMTAGVSFRPSRPSGLTKRNATPPSPCVTVTGSTARVAGRSM
jgi:hypothetical protein